MKKFDRLATVLVKRNQPYLIELLEFAKCDIDSRLGETKRRDQARSSQDWDFVDGPTRSAINQSTRSLESRVLAPAS
jgi:hypothetical protein